MIQLSDRRLWMAAGALGAAVLLGGTAVLSHTPARTTPTAHRATLSQQPAMAGGALAGPALSAAPDERVPAPAAGAPPRPVAVPASQAQPGSGIPAAPDRCMAVVGQGRPLPMCAPLAPQP